MSKHKFYCWLRVLPASSKAERYVVDDRGRDDQDPPQPLLITSGGRPPKRSSVESKPGADSDAWIVDELADGDAASPWVIDYGPVYRHRQMALSWLLTGKGRQWASAASNYVLMCFERETP